MFINKDLYKKCNSELSIGQECLVEYEQRYSFFSMGGEDTKKLFKAIVFEVTILKDPKAMQKLLKKYEKRYDLDDCKHIIKSLSHIAVMKTEKKDEDESGIWIVGRNKKTGFWYGDMNSGSLMVRKPVIKIGFDQVCISEPKKNLILDTLSQIKYSDLIFNKWGFSNTIEKGRALTLLFYGKPGTGKTLMAQAIADHLDFDLLTITPTDLNDKYFGETEKRIREVFQKADSKTVILFDECDGLIMDRNKGSAGLVAHINQFIYDIEHFDGICVFTTNNIDFLDKALERRLALKIEFEEPDEKTRKMIWEKLIPKQCPVNKDVDFEFLSQFPLNGGHIKNIVLNAARTAARDQSVDLNMAHFMSAIGSENDGIKGFNKIK